MNCSFANSQYYEEDKVDKVDYKKFSDDVMQSLKSHPDGMSRAAAIDSHIRQNAKLANLARKGKSKASLDVQLKGTRACVASVPTEDCSL